MLAVLGGAGLNDQILVLHRGEVADIITGWVFLLVGLATCSFATIRRQSGVRTFIWDSGARPTAPWHLNQSAVVVSMWQHWPQIGAPYASTARTYLMVVAGSLLFTELSLGRVRPSRPS